MKDGEMDAGAWSCGMVAGLIHDVPTVQELIDRIMREAEEIIGQRLARFAAHSAAIAERAATNPWCGGKPALCPTSCASGPPVSAWPRWASCCRPPLRRHWHAQPKPLKPVTIALGTQVVNVTYPWLTLPIALGYWKAEGYDVKIVTTGGSLQGIQQMVAGGVDFAQVNATGPDPGQHRQRRRGARASWAPA
jgi:hypothetical protein